MNQIESNQIESIASYSFAVSNAGKPPKAGFVRVWFNDGIGTTTGWRDIPESRIQEAREYQHDKGQEGYQEFDFSMIWP